MYLKNLLPSWLFKDFFLDWQLENWQNIYANQDNLLQTNYDETIIKIPQVVVFDNIDRQFGSKQIKFLLRRDKFHLSSDLNTAWVFYLYRKFCWFRRRKLFNDTCLRLSSISRCKDFKLSAASQYILFEVQESDYFDYVQTNLCLDAPLQHTKESLREKIHIKQNRCLESLKDSKLANLLGINILLITSDKKVILQKRSLRTLIRPGEFCPSASGTLTRADIPDYEIEYSLSELIPSFLRELVEEIGINLAEVAKHEVNLLGVTRELIRGGQPEMFFSMNIRANKREILNNYQKARDRFESDSLFFLDVEPVLMEKDVCQNLEHMLFLRLTESIGHRNYKLISVPLWTNLSLWCKSLIHRLGNG